MGAGIETYQFLLAYVQYARVGFKVNTFCPFYNFETFDRDIRLISQAETDEVQHDEWSKARGFLFAKIKCLSASKARFVGPKQKGIKKQSGTKVPRKNFGNSNRGPVRAARQEVNSRDTHSH